MSGIKTSELSLEGLMLIEMPLFRDNRGFFQETFQSNHFREANLPFRFVQDNHSRSLAKVLRGLHYQKQPWQGKLVTVLRGRIWDVAVDLRPESPTMGKHIGIELNDQNGFALWIPGGFAHGFCVLGEEAADVIYKVDQPYSAKTEGGICWSDPELAIPWPISQPIVSERDQRLQTFASYRQSLVPFATQCDEL